MRRIAVLLCIPEILVLTLTAQGALAADVALSPDEIKRLEIKLEPAKPATEEAVAVLPGVVIRQLNARSSVTAPYAGTVTELHVLPGERVAKGAPLVTISSRDYLEAQTSLATSEADLQIAEATARRKRMLADKNFQNPDVAAEAEAQVLKIKAVIDRHKRELALDGITPKDAASFVLPAAAEGIVVETTVMPGDKVEAMGPVATIDTSDALWIDVQVPASVLASIRTGDTVLVENSIEGRIVALSGSLDAATRSAKLYASLPAGSGLIPGQMVSVTLKKETVAGALSVPSNAVTRIGDKPSLFVKTETGFTVKPIELRGRSPLEATVLGELAAGDQVAASGIPELEQMLANE